MSCVALGDRPTLCRQTGSRSAGQLLQLDRLTGDERAPERGALRQRCQRPAASFSRRSAAGAGDTNFPMNRRRLKAFVGTEAGVRRALMC